MKKKTLLLLLCNLTALGLSLNSAQAQGTAFTYQGRLNDAGNLPSGTYDMYFSLFATSSGGTTLGVVTNRPVAVSNGLFTVTLDFGSGVFTGAARWLEIGVRTNGSSGFYTTLAPRQQVTPAPYAITAGDVTSGNIARLNVSNYFAGPNNFAGPVGIGTTAPQYPLHVAGAGVALFGRGGYTGLRGESGATDGFGVVGYTSASSGFTRGVYGQSDSPGGYGVHGYSPAGGGVAGVTVNGYAVVGQATFSGGFGGLFRYGTDGNNSAYLGFNGGAADFYGRVSVNGNLCYTGTFGTCSDQRYKDKIERLPDSLQRALKLRGVSYVWRRSEFPRKQFPEGRQIGFIAQEIEELYPELVATDNDGYKTVDYSRLTPVLVEAIKELHTLLETKNKELLQLRAEFNSQKEFVRRTEARFAELERAVAHVTREAGTTLAINRSATEEQ